jgi:excisionase family DNA binding protein
MPNPSISNGAFMNTDEAAAMLGVHPKTLQRLARSGRITAYRVGKLWRFQARDLWADVAVPWADRMRTGHGSSYAR